MFPWLQAPPFPFPFFPWLLLVWILHHHACPKCSSIFSSPAPGPLCLEHGFYLSFLYSRTFNGSSGPAAKSVLFPWSLTAAHVKHGKSVPPLPPHLSVPLPVHLPLTQPGIQLTGRPVSSFNKPHIPASPSLTNISSP